MLYVKNACVWKLTEEVSEVMWLKSLLIELVSPAAPPPPPSPAVDWDGRLAVCLEVMIVDSCWICDSKSLICNNKNCCLLVHF